jgi:hypothetical protein
MVLCRTGRKHEQGCADDHRTADPARTLQPPRSRWLSDGSADRRITIKRSNLTHSGAGKPSLGGIALLPALLVPLAAMTEVPVAEGIDWLRLLMGLGLMFYGMGVMGDEKIVDEALARVVTSGEAEQIYTEWFLQPIPAKGLNLNFALSYANKTLYEEPNDKAFE